MLQQAGKVLVGAVLGHPRRCPKALDPGGERVVVVDADDDDAWLRVHRAEAGEHVKAILDETIVEDQDVSAPVTEGASKRLTRPRLAQEQDVRQLPEQACEGFARHPVAVCEDDAHATARS